MLNIFLHWENKDTARTHDITTDVLLGPPIALIRQEKSHEYRDIPQVTAEEQSMKRYSFTTTG